MKHAAILYTCIGLMGAAAVTGFVDYTHASKAGLLNDLYKEETATTGSTLIDNKEIKLEDYSRGPIEMVQDDQQDDKTLSAQTKKPKKKKKLTPPPPPNGDVPAPPPPPGKIIENIPPTPPKVEVPEVIEVTPAVPEVPTVVTVDAAPTAPEVEETKFDKVMKIYSRAPLPPKKTIVKRKKNQ